MHALHIRRSRPGVILAAALTLLGLVVLAGVLRADGPSAASTGTASCSPARQWYIDANGRPQLLPWCGEAAGEASAVYVGRWLRGPKLDIAGTGAAPAVTPSPSSSPTDAAGEVVPVLSLADGPSVVAGTKPTATVPLKWTRAVAPTGDTVDHYIVQAKRDGSTAWTSALGATTTALRADAAGLDTGTLYGFRVQAVYMSGARGPWSATLQVTTPTA